MSATLGVIVVLVAGAVVRQRRAAERTEAEVVAELREQTPDPSAVLAQVDLPGVSEDPDVTAHVMLMAHTLQGAISTCTDRWPGHPAEVRVRLRSDAAGRLIELAVEGAPSEASSCLLAVLKRGQFPRNTHAIAPLTLNQ